MVDNAHSEAKAKELTAPKAQDQMLGDSEEPRLSQFQAFSLVLQERLSLQLLTSRTRPNSHTSQDALSEVYSLEELPKFLRTQLSQLISKSLHSRLTASTSH